MTEDNLIQLGFQKVLVTEEELELDFYYFEKSINGLSFLTGNNAEAEATGNWYIEDSSFTIRIWKYSEAKDLINIIERNLVLK